MTVHVLRLPLTIDPLIKEATRRGRRRRLLLSVALAGVVALGAGLTLALRPAGYGSTGAWVPPGVQEIDVRSAYSPRISLHVTDPAQVKLIAGWFNALKRNPKLSPSPDGRHFSCLGFAPSVTFKFRAANGADLATAYSTGGMAGYCNPIQLTVGGAQSAYFLVDRGGGYPPTWPVDPNQPGSLISRVERVLAVKLPLSHVING